MKRGKAGAITILAFALITTGCANQTSDPHQGGLFSYNPGAYEQRIREREETLSRLKTQNSQLEKNEASLADRKRTRERELAALRKTLAQLSTSTTALEEKVRRAELRAGAREQERSRILAQLKEVQASSRAAADSADIAKQQLELKRLKKKRAQLEKEIEELMQL